MVYYSVIKRNEVRITERPWMNLGDITINDK